MSEHLLRKCARESTIDVIARQAWRKKKRKLKTLAQTSIAEDMTKESKSCEERR
jgi:hypothetical protein